MLTMAVMNRTEITSNVTFVNYRLQLYNTTVMFHLLTTLVT